MKKIFPFIIIFLWMAPLHAQDTTQAAAKDVYHIQTPSEIWITAGLAGLNMAGLAVIMNKGTLSESEVIKLSKKDVPAFDRSALRQSYPVPGNIYDIANIGLYGTSALVPLLLLDDDIREDWLDIGLLFIETQSINLNIYMWSGPAFTKRIRPIVYYDEVSMETKTGKEKTDSFFSGHVSTTATASFFMAKVYSDYHPRLGAAKWWLFAAAVVPPAVVGYGRYRGLMHFPSDILLGFTVGATVGFLVPHLHKTAYRDTIKLSLAPLAGEYKGLNVSLTF